MSEIVTNYWTINGTYTGEVKRIGRTRDFILEGKGKLVLVKKDKAVV